MACLGLHHPNQARLTNALLNRGRAGPVNEIV
jgi:hypothetical protein